MLGGATMQARAGYPSSTLGLLTVSIERGEANMGLELLARGSELGSLSHQTTEREA